MKNYQLIALDMDGTLLNSQKQISIGNQQAIQKASEAGKIVILNTGRSPAELEEFYEILPTLQYINCLSGALVYDIKNKKSIYSSTLDIEIVKRLLEITTHEDCMVHMLSKESIVQKNKVEVMENYHMGVYKDMFRCVATKHENLIEFYNNHPFTLEKFNIYHATKEGRERTKQRILDANLDVELANAEAAGLEVNVKGIHKGIGLKELAKYLNISMEEVIVVGDADNDLEALKVAGLPVAMGNASNHIKDICKVVVADNDHDGVAEVIEKYLL